MKTKKAVLIKQFILLNEPTRKQIVQFIYCDLNDHDPRHFNEDYKGNVRGYYAVGFRSWKVNGNTEVRNGKYYITESCRKEGNGLYSMNKDMRIKLLTKKADYFSSEYASSDLQIINCRRKLMFWRANTIHS